MPGDDTTETDELRAVRLTPQGVENEVIGEWDNMMSTSALSLADARAVLQAQPFSVLVGAELPRFEAGQATLTLTLRDDLRQQNGFAHGGIVSYAADNAITFAAGSVAGPDVLTSGIQVNYLAGARGDLLEASATVVDVGRRLVTVRCDVFDHRDGHRHLCAVAQGTVIRTNAASARSSQDGTAPQA